jgi:phosphotransferase system IIB component
MGSRIVLVLKDYQKIDQAKLKEAGVDSFIEMSDRLTLVIKDNADKVYHTIFG